MRGIKNNQLLNDFKESKLFKLYKEHLNELFIGVRNDYINLYYNCDSIAEIENDANSCKIASYYLDENDSQSSNYIKVSADTIYQNYELIKMKSAARNTNEKKAQAALVLNNNQNPKSNWYCLDIEYISTNENGRSNNAGRFDIIAIEKAVPHRVALIELKYGGGSISGESGIYSHIKDFKTFKDNSYFNNMKIEIVNIISNQIQLGVDVPHELVNLKDSDIFADPDFYIIMLNNNPQTPNSSSPKQTMAGYLFDTKRWDCKRLTTKNSVEHDFGDVTNKSNDFTVTFLFSTEILPNIAIDDIIDSDKYERISPK